MAKGIKGSTRTGAFVNNAGTTSGSNVILTEVDVGTAKNGLLIVTADIDGTEYLTDMQVVTSINSGVPVSGTQAATSDVCTLVQDTVNSTGATTVTANTCTINTNGIYVYDVYNLSRYVNIQYTGTGTSTIATAVIVATDLEQAPHATATTAY